MSENKDMSHLGWPGNWAAEGRALLETRRRPARMSTTVSVPM